MTVPLLYAKIVHSDNRIWGPRVANTWDIEVTFLQWLKIGFSVGVITMFLAMLAVIFIPFFSY